MSGGGDGADDPHTAYKTHIDQIVEVCNVPRDDAYRVLERSRFDVQVAIDRFLSGLEEEWSEVSKKKKPTEKKSNVQGKSTRYGGSNTSDRAYSSNTSYQEGRDGYRSYSGGNVSGRGRGRRPKGSYGSTRPERDNAPRKSHQEPEPAWANSKAEPSWASKKTEESLPEWADASPNTDAPDGGWSVDSWTIKEDLKANGPAAWGLEDQDPVNPLAQVPTSAMASAPVGVTGTSASGSVLRQGQADSEEIPETDRDRATDSLGTSAVPGATKSSPAEDTTKRPLNFAAVVAAGTIHDKKVHTSKDTSKPSGANPQTTSVIGGNKSTSRHPMAPVISPAEAASRKSYGEEKKILENTNEHVGTSAEVGDPVANEDVAAWSPVVATEDVSKGEPAATIDAKSAPNAGLDNKTTGDGKRLMQNFGMDQLGLQFGSFPLNDQPTGAASVTTSRLQTMDKEWQNEGSAAGAKESSPGGGRPIGVVSSAPVIENSGKVPGETAPVSSSGQYVETSRNSGAGNLYESQHSGYASQQNQPQQYPVMPIPFTQYEQSGVRGVPSGPMNSYYNPSVMGMMPQQLNYRDGKQGGPNQTAEAQAGNGTREASGKHQNSRAGGGGGGGAGVQNVHGRQMNNSGLEQQVNSYMMAPGFSPYASMYAFPHNPYGGTTLGHPPYPQYAPAGGPPHRGSNRMHGYDERGFGPGMSEGPDSRMYPPFAFYGPMMPDMQQQAPQHAQQQQGATHGNSRGKTDNPSKQGNEVIQHAHTYPAEYGAQVHPQQLDWRNASNEGNRPESDATEAAMHSRVHMSGVPVTDNKEGDPAQASLYNNSLPGQSVPLESGSQSAQHRGHGVQQTQEQGQGGAPGFYNQSNSTEQHPFFPTYY